MDQARNRALKGGSARIQGDAVDEEKLKRKIDKMAIPALG